MAPEKWGGVPGSGGCGLKGTGLNHPGTLGRGSELGGRAESRLASCLSAGPPVSSMQGVQEGRLMRGGWRGGAPVSGPASGPREQRAERRGSRRTARPGGPDRYRLLHAGRVQVWMLVASGGGRDGRGARGLVNRNGLQA